MIKRAVNSLLLFIVVIQAIGVTRGAEQSVVGPIDREALVTRHDPTLTAVDPASPLMVGNGSIAFTADITGLQTFQDAYSPLVPLLTQAQWAWHSFPNPKGFKIEDALVPMKVRGRTRQYPALTNWDQAQSEQIKWLRENPHRFNLGRIGLYLARADGKPVSFADLQDTRQALNLWTGRLNSRFVFDGQPVEVETSVPRSRHRHRASALRAAVGGTRRNRSALPGRRSATESRSLGLDSRGEALHPGSLA